MDSFEKVTHAGGATSSRIPRFDLIPLEALEALANRYEYGAAKHGEMNWRGGLPIHYPPSKPSGPRDYLIARLSHVIHHSFKLIAKLQGLRPNDGDDDAGAILWGGSFAATYQAQVKKLMEDDAKDVVKKIAETL